MEESTRYANQIAKVENDSALEAVKKSGKTTVYTCRPRKSVWPSRRRWSPVHQKMESRVSGKDVIQAVYKDTGFKPGQPLSRSPYQGMLIRGLRAPEFL